MPGGVHRRERRFTGEALDIKLTLQYNLNGNAKYDEISRAKAESGRWVTLSNTAFTVPEGAADLMLYAEIPGSLADLYLDAVAAGKAGT